MDKISNYKYYYMDDQATFLDESYKIANFSYYSNMYQNDMPKYGKNVIPKYGKGLRMIFDGILESDATFIASFNKLRLFLIDYDYINDKLSDYINDTDIERTTIKDQSKSNYIRRIHD